MENKLLPIYKLRMVLLKMANSKYFNENRAMILRTSLAAQDYVLSGHYYEYDKKRMGQNFKTLPEYVSVHKKYNLPYDPNLFILLQGNINPGLVMDLSWSLQQDKIKGIVDENGNIKNSSGLPQSEVMHVYHNSSISGTPIDVIKTMKSEQLDQLVRLVQQKTR